MNILSLFKRKEKGIKKVEELVHYYKDIPGVIFDDEELRITIGQWLGLLSSEKMSGSSSIAFVSHLSAKELIKNTKIPESTLRQIEETFGKILNMAGIDKDETCLLSNFNKDDFSFHCHLGASNRSANIKMRWGDFFESCPELIIENEKGEATYEYIEAYKDRPMRLSLTTYTINNPTNGNSLYRYLSPFRAYYTLKNENIEIELTVAKPQDDDVETSMESVYNLKNNSQLQDYFLGLNKPFDISSIYKAICETSIESLSDHPTFALEIKERIDKYKERVISGIYLENGVIVKLIIDRNGNIITIDGSGQPIDVKKLLSDTDEQVSSDTLEPEEQKHTL